MLDVLEDAVVLAVRLYADLVSLAGLLLIRLPWAVVSSPVRWLARSSSSVHHQRRFSSVFITGASVGLGAGLAKAYAKPGVRLFLTAQSLAGLEQTKLVCESRGAAVTCLAIDVRDEKGMEQAINAAHAVQRLDLVIANAGISTKRSGIEETKLVLETNVLGMANTIVPALQLMIKEMRSRDGYFPQLVLMGSLGGYGASGSLFMAPYVASKSAIRVYGESLRTVLLHECIGVTVIAPGMTESRMVAEQTEAGIHMVTGVWPVERAIAVMQHGIALNKAEVAYPFAWMLVARTFGNVPAWVRDAFASITLRNDPYHAMDPKLE